MAEAGSFADRVKQQADIVRVIGEYVRLKKSGQNFTGLCPFHQEKTPSFAVHPVKQIYHCFGCGVGGDVFKFVMEMEKSPFPEAIRTVAEKCGIADSQAARTLARRAPRKSAALRARRNASRGRGVLRARNCTTAPKGKCRRVISKIAASTAKRSTRFGLGYAPSSGDALLRFLKQKYPEKLLESSGLVSRAIKAAASTTASAAASCFPSRMKSGKVIAFGGRAMGDDMPKYMNSPETPIYTKSSVLYHLDRAKEAIRQERFRHSRRRLHGHNRRGARRIRKRRRQLRHQPRRAASQIAQPIHAPRHRQLRSGHSRPSRHGTLHRAVCSKKNSTSGSSRCPAAPIPTNS